MGVIENIQSLITAANATTSKSDTDMTSATKSLIAGYGGSGKPEEVKTVDITTNGKTEILPTPGSVMSKVVANVNVPTGGDHSMEDGFLSGTITAYSNDRVTEIGDYIFDGRKEITEIHLPQMKKNGTNSFRQCGIVNLYFPNLETEGSSAFRQCVNLETVLLPKLENVGSFSEAPHLRQADFGNQSISHRFYFGQWAFEKDEKLTTLILRYNNVPNLFSTNSFFKTPIEAGAGYIYVPKVLVDEYKVATNWATFATQFRAIEDYPEITGG